MAEKFGYVTQVIGPVVDVIFEKDGEDLPPIYEALPPLFIHLRAYPFLSPILRTNYTYFTFP